MGPWLICAAALAIDGDTLRCLDGTRIRVAGIEANELHQPGCHLPVCPVMPGPIAKQHMQALIGRQNLTYRATGKSWNRVTAEVRLGDGRDLSCEAIRLGIAVRCERYWPHGKRC